MAKVFFINDWHDCRYILKTEKKRMTYEKEKFDNIIKYIDKYRKMQ